MLLRLAGPLQSWGERSAFNTERDSAAFPTRSALIGMFAAAQGLNREHDLSRYRDLSLIVRVDRPGTRLVDYHTVGGGLPKEQTLVTAGGSHKGAAVITHRHYLADAVFVIAVSGTEDTLAPIIEALRRPHWAPYLGRRACVPDEPLLLRTDVHDPVAALRDDVPLSPAAPPSPGEPTVPVEFLWEQRPAHLPAHTETLSVNDTPLSFTPGQRRYTRRTLYRTVERLRSDLCAVPGQLHEQLIDYALETVA
ncbi:type I-E CRISPR-associated protein Cas5/CasD [Streptomyces sp. TRM49041]|uniref:type I-E CRISPR-associated protein Cas5/CasD n=1 Tax=Streptomyces sp. TRM49041 TaxID=2603216 RepID=UPI0021CC5827|nr:type I-E CRISPR-associated protein Cas5/CasD [Streptomyces sp. TRM49041]